MIESIDPRKAALILIDLQNDVVQRYPNGNQIVSRVADVLDTSRKAGVTIIFVKVEFREHPREVVDTLTDLRLSGKEPWPSKRSDLVVGTSGSQIVEALKILPNDLVVIKHRTGAFYCTALELYLRALSINTLVICGVSTNMGVETTVREAAMRDFNIIVLSDCCTASPTNVHNYPVQYVFPRLGRVLTSSEFQGVLYGSRS